jgi:hypothetical protein
MKIVWNRIQLTALVIVTIILLAFTVAETFFDLRMGASVFVGINSAIIVALALFLYLTRDKKTSN